MVLRLRLALKILLGGISAGLTCAGLGMMGGTEFINVSIIWGGIGFIFGSLIIFSHWINYELYQKRLFPYIIQRAQDTVDKLKASSSRQEHNRTNTIDGVETSTKWLGKQTRFRKMLFAASFMAILGAICWGGAGAIGGGSAGAVSGAILGAVVGLTAWAIGWMFGLYKAFLEKDSD